MLNIGTGELFLILLVALIVFGPKRLPEIMRNLGKAWRAVQEESQKATSMLREGLEDRTPPAAPAPPPAEQVPPEVRRHEDT